MSRTRGENSGFSLVDLLLATICLAVAALGVLSGLAYANNKTVTAKQRALAVQYAASQMDTIKGDSLRKALTAGTTSSTVAVAGIPNTVTCTRSVSAIATDLYYAQVQLTWTIQSVTGPSTQNVVLETMVWNGHAS